VSAGSASPPRSPLLEPLGFGPDERVAVVHVDDLGMCHAANDGGFQALAAGPATCGSLMVPCPWFAEAVGIARARPGVDLGVHLTLNCEWSVYRWGPVAGRERVPSLCAPDGGLWRTVAETLTHADPDEVETELRAQIERALAAGIDVTHLDSHMGTVFMPPFVDVYAKLALEYRLPAFAVRPSHAQLAARGASEAAGVVLAAVERMAEGGVPVLDHFDADSLSFGPGEGERHNRERLRGLPVGVTYLICHAAQASPELEAMMDHAHCRDFERRFYGGEPGRRAFEEEGIRTVGMRALRDLMRAG